MKPKKASAKKLANHAIYMRTRWYPANRKKHMDLVRAWKIKIKSEHDAKKNKPCADCGNIFHPCAMDWDHVSGKKTANISELSCNGSRNRLDEELKKCELVCANCHRIRTWKRKQEDKLFKQKSQSSLAVA